MPFADEVVLITGAGSGIGRAMAQEFNAEGATVAALDVHAGAAKQTAESLGGDASAVVADLRSRADVDRAVAEVIERHGRIDVLCNNAGVLDGYADALNTSDELWDNIIATNLTGPFKSRAALPHMIERGSGAIATPRRRPGHVRLRRGNAREGGAVAHPLALRRTRDPKRP